MPIGQDAPAPMPLEHEATILTPTVLRVEARAVLDEVCGEGWEWSDVGHKAVSRLLEGDGWLAVLERLPQHDVVTWAACGDPASIEWVLAELFGVRSYSVATTGTQFLESVRAQVFRSHATTDPGLVFEYLTFVKHEVVFLKHLLDTDPSHCTDTWQSLLLYTASRQPHIRSTAAYVMSVLTCTASVPQDTWKWFYAFEGGLDICLAVLRVERSKHTVQTLTNIARLDPVVYFTEEVLARVADDSTLALLLTDVVQAVLSQCMTVGGHGSGVDWMPVLEYVQQHTLVPGKAQHQLVEVALDLLIGGEAVRRSKGLAAHLALLLKGNALQLSYPDDLSIPCKVLAIAAAGAPSWVGVYMRILRNKWEAQEWRVALVNYIVQLLGTLVALGVGCGMLDNVIHMYARTHPRSVCNLDIQLLLAMSLVDAVSTEHLTKFLVIFWDGSLSPSFARNHRQLVDAAVHLAGSLEQSLVDVLPSLFETTFERTYAYGADSVRHECMLSLVGALLHPASGLSKVTTKLVKLLIRKELKKYNGHPHMSVLAARSGIEYEGIAASVASVASTPTLPPLRTVPPPARRASSLPAQATRHNGTGASHLVAGNQPGFITPVPLRRAEESIPLGNSARGIITGHTLQPGSAASHTPRPRSTLCPAESVMSPSSCRSIASEESEEEEDGAVGSPSPSSVENSSGGAHLGLSGASHAAELSAKRISRESVEVPDRRMPNPTGATGVPTLVVEPVTGAGVSGNAQLKRIVLSDSERPAVDGECLNREEEVEEDDEVEAGQGQRVGEIVPSKQDAQTAHQLELLVDTVSSLAMSIKKRDTLSAWRSHQLKLSELRQQADAAQRNEEARKDMKRMKRQREIESRLADYYKRSKEKKEQERLAAERRRVEEEQQLRAKLNRQEKERRRKKDLVEAFRKSKTNAQSKGTVK